MTTRVDANRTRPPTLGSWAPVVAAAGLGSGVEHLVHDTIKILLVLGGIIFVVMVPKISSSPAVSQPSTSSSPSIGALRRDR
jgi:hypothetical protein